MADYEEDLELHRFASGELSPEQSAAFLKRMMRDPALRAAGEEIRRVDALARAACFDDALERDEGRRQEQINSILAAVRDEAAARRPVRRWVRLLPWAVAAASVAAAVLIVCTPRPLTPAPAPAEAVRPMSAQDISRLADLRKHLGDDAVIIWNGDDGSVDMVQHAAAPPVLVRLTVMRTVGQVTETWTADGIIPHDRSVEMVAQERPWPASLRLQFKPDHDGTLVLSLHARLDRDTPSDLAVDATVRMAKPTSVAILQCGRARYEVFIQAESAEPTDGIM